MDYSLYQQFSSYFPQFSRGIVKNFLLLAQALLASRSTNLNTVKDRIGTLLGQVLCIVYQQVAIPIFWRDLDHDGHSNGLERQELMRDAARLFNLKGKTLLADRDGAARAVCGR